MISPRKRLGQNRREGFSLIELLVASLIFSILLVGYMSLFQYAIKSWMSTLSRMERSSNINGATDVIMPDMRSILPPYSISSAVGMRGWNSGDALGFTQTGNADDLIQFHGASWTSTEGDGTSTSNYDLVKLSYFLRRDGTEDSRLMRGYEGGDDADTVPSIGSGISAPQDFAFRIKSFNLEYMNDANGWNNTWQTSSTANLPKLIRITMKASNPVLPTDVYTTVSVIRPRATGRKITQ